MPSLNQLICHLLTKPLLKQHLIISLDVSPRCIARSLRVLIIVDHSAHHLKMALVLHVAAHDAKAHFRFTCLR